MNIFRKEKKDKDNGRNELSDSDDDKKKKTRKKRQKKEQQKPWGRKERLIVCAIILITAGTSAVLALSAREWKLPGFPRIKLSRPNFSFLKSETIVFENSDLVSQSEQKEKASNVKHEFKLLTEDLSGVYGLYIIDLDTGFSFGVNTDEVYQAASLIKLPVMAAMYIESENGNLDLETKYVLKASDKIAGAGSLYSKPVGYEITNRNLVRLMGIQSDNTAFNIAQEIIGDEKIKKVINKIGMTETSLENNETSLEDIGIFFEELWHGNIVNENNKGELLEYLTDTVFEEWIASGLPDDIAFAHKFGRETHVVNDAGIVFSQKPFVFVVLSKGAVEREADNVFPELARAVFNLWAN